MNPLLSIITPVYNVELYLDRCVQSVLSQSYQEIELILVDDGSTDGSGKKCDQWAKLDKRITVIHKKNGGVSSARNEGLEVAKGEYLTFVDPDDFLEPDTYQPNMDYLIRHPEIDILQFPYCHYFSDHEVTNYHRPAKILLSGTEQVFKNWWSGSPLEYVVWNKIYKRHLWSTIKFSVGHTSEDTILVPRFVSQAKYVYISKQGLYYYRRSRKDSYTYVYDFEKHMDLFYAHAAIYECFSMFPDMVTEKVLAFTRLFRRLIIAKQTNATAEIGVPLKLIRSNYPNWHEILSSQNTEKIWLSAAKLLGTDLFIKMFCAYLKIKQRVICLCSVYHTKNYFILL